VAADRERAQRVQFRGAQGVTEAHYVAWLVLDRTNVNEKDVLVGDISSLNFGTAGALTRAKDATTQFTPVVRTTSSGMLMSSETVSMMPDVVGLFRDYKPGGTPLTIAARVSGDAKSAFPDGRPKAPAKEEKKSDAKDAAKDKAADKTEDKAAKAPAKQPAAKTAAKAPPPKTPPPKTADNKKGAPAPKTAEKKADTPAGEKKADAKEAKTPPAPPPKPHVAAGKVNVIVIADTDFLQDQFWFQKREFLGQQVIDQTAHNNVLVLAALENLSGTDALISLRARGVATRPFKLVEELRRKAEERFRRSEQVLLARLKEVQSKLANLKKGEGDEVTLSLEQRKEIEAFEKDRLDVRRQLREVQRALRKDIDRLDGMLKFFNIAAVPLLIGIVGVGWAYRRRRSTTPPQAAETLS
jgi:ABC-type uncharacterized transport system involved in gliding motility auxiliary subunit